MTQSVLYPKDASPEPSEFEPLAASVGRYLREAILEGHLEPGDKIRQEAIAQEFGVSRIPVREALLELATEGLVSLTPHSGARVASLDFDELSEIYKIRERLEPLAILESVPRLSDQQLTTMRRLVEAIDGSHDPNQWLLLDRDLHLTSYAAAPMPRLLRMIQGFWNSTQQYRRAFYSESLDLRSPSVVPPTHYEHWLLLDACERRDATYAEWLIGAHIRRTRILLIHHRELFDKPAGRKGSRHGLQSVEPRIDHENSVRAG